MRWRFVDTGFNTGKYNMDFDLRLIGQIEKNEAVLRFYRWKPYCISLGANQSYDSINIGRAEKTGIDVVKRPTGGRAILHAEELTYSVVHPVTSELSPKNLYREINTAIRNGLSGYHHALKNLSLENFQPHFPSLYEKTEGSLCFAVSAKSEINFEGKKLVGSAQRKIGDLILQHGSILCGTFHRNLIEFLELSLAERTKLKKEIIETTIELETILNSKIDYSKLALALKSGFEEHFNSGIEIKNKVEFVS